MWYAQGDNALAVERFQAWLETHGQHDYVGHIGDLVYSPVARFIAAQGYTGVSVTSFFAVYHSANSATYHRQQLPYELQRFESLALKHCPEYFIRAGQALRLLRIARYLEIRRARV